MAQQSDVLAKAAATTATGSPAPVQVKAKPSVVIKYRLFAAEQTKKLDPTLSGAGPSKTLAGLALILGTVEGGVFKPFEDRIRAAPIPLSQIGEMHNGAFRPLSAEQLSEWTSLDAKRKNKKLSAEERKKANEECVAKFPKVADGVMMHVLPLPKRIEPGTTIGICINVDAKSKFRRYPLWQVTAGDHDIVIDVFETYGKRGLNDKATKKDTRDEGTKEAAHPVDYYAAELNGDVWLRSTHPFTAADVDALPAEVAGAAMKTALKKIYSADFTMVGADFAIDVPRGQDKADTATARLYWIAAENNNCVSNVKAIDIKRDVPSRIHPAAYAAVANAAFDVKLTEVRFSSSWRPMLGSMGHRSGRGLDMVLLKDSDTATRLNREGLTSGGTTDKNHDGIVDDARGHHNITVEEQEAFNAWKKSEVDLNSAVDAWKRAKATSDAAQKALAAATKSGSADAIEKAEHAQTEAQKSDDAARQTAEDAAKVVPQKKRAWEKQVEKHQPSRVGQFRRALMKADAVTQIIDPWYIDLNTHDKVDGVVNEQKKDGLQDIHKNHLHLTIYDSELKG